VGVVITGVRWLFFLIVTTGLSILVEQAGLFDGMSSIEQVIVGATIGLIGVAIAVTIAPMEES
jgi:hypothetical protein